MKFSYSLLERILIACIIISVGTQVALLLQNLPPQTVYPDGPQHIKLIELINEDSGNYFYNPGYRKAFHVTVALISGVLPIGLSMAIVTILFYVFFVIFARRLAYFFSGDSIVSLFTALLSTSIIIFSSVGPLISLVPQSMGLSLSMMLLYYFFSNDWKKTSALLLLFAFTHTSVIFFIGLMGIAACIQFFMEKKTTFFNTIARALAILFAVSIIVSLFLLRFNSNYLDVGPTVGLFDFSISPLALLQAVYPSGILIVGLIGVWVCRKKLPAYQHVILTIWFAFPILYSQSYWLNFQIFPASRGLIFMLFPLALFSAYTIRYAASLFHNHIKQFLAIMSVGILFISIFGYTSFFAGNIHTGITSLITNEQFEVIDFLKKFPLDQVVVAEGVNTNIITLGHKKSSSARNYWYILANQSIEKQLENHDIHFLLFDKNLVLNTDLFFGVEKIFENDQYVVYRVMESVQTTHSTALADQLLSFVSYWDLTQNQFQADNPYYIKLLATDTGEEACVVIRAVGPRISNCISSVSLTVSGEKEILSELLNSYNKTYFLAKTGTFLNTNAITVSPKEILFVQGGPYNVEQLLYLESYTNTSIYSSPNTLIAEFLWDYIVKKA